MRIKDFFDTDFKTFSNADNIRSIPSLIDGLKDSQRKAVFGMTVHGVSEVKVSQAAELCSSATHYEHGSGSLEGTIVLLAQDFTGSNNVNLLEPIGQFGSILSSSASASRYIYTRLSNNFRKYFKKEDDCILEHRYEDGDKVEPLLYFPTLPMWIVNGALGIGTGHSVNILSRTANNASAAIKLIVKNGKLTEKEQEVLLKPSFNGWKGEVKSVEGRWEFHGKIEKVNTTTLKVTELPIGYDVKKFKTILIKLLDDGEIKDFANKSTEKGFNFVIDVAREVGRKTDDQLKEMFKLVSRATENITLWDSKGKLQKYPSVYEALLEFVEFRLEKYEQRRLTHISLNEERNDFLFQKMAFIIAWNEMTNPGKLKKEEIIKAMPTIKTEYFERFFSLRISSLTLEEIEALDKEIKENEKLLTTLKASKAKDIYLNEV